MNAAGGAAGRAGPWRVLIVEDDRLDATLTIGRLRDGGADATTTVVDDRTSFEAALAEPPDLILCDFRLPTFDALSALDLLRERGLDIPVIVVSGAITEELAVECMRRGAADYLLKDRLGRLVQSATRAIADQRLRAEARRSVAEAVERQRMESIGRLAGGIAHDFNNILAAIVTFAELALLEMPEGGAGRTEIGEILHGADRATALIRQILAFSRKQILQPTAVDLNEIVADLDSTLRRPLGSQITLTVDGNPGPAWVYVDRAQIEQVIVNLVINARDALPAGGKIRIRIGHETVGSHGRAGGLGAGAYARLEVSDTGVGMDDATMGRIFEPFFTTKRGRGGTGLGLATAHGIIEQSGGKITVTSRPAEGSWFVILLPSFDPGSAVPEAGDARYRDELL